MAATLTIRSNQGKKTSSRACWCCCTCGDTVYATGYGCNHGTNARTWKLTVAGITACPCAGNGSMNGGSFLTSSNMNGTFCLDGCPVDWVTQEPFYVTVQVYDGVVCTTPPDPAIAMVPCYWKLIRFTGQWILSCFSAAPYAGYYLFYSVLTTSDPIDCNKMLVFNNALMAGDCGYTVSGTEYNPGDGYNLAWIGTAVLTPCCKPVLAL